MLDSVMPGEAGERLAVMERLGGAEAREIARRFWAGEPEEEVRDAYLRVCLPLYSQRPGGDPDGPDRLRRIRWNYDVLEHFRRTLHDAFDPWPSLGAVTCPAMILAGAHDPVATDSAARRLAAALPDAALHVLPDAGHGIFREDPGRACALLRDFVGAIEWTRTRT